MHYNSPMGVPMGGFDEQAWREAVRERIRSAARDYRAAQADVRLLEEAAGRALLAFSRRLGALAQRLLERGRRWPSSSAF